MPQPNNSVKEQMLKLEKLVKKVIRKSLKDNTLDYTVQISTSNLEPGKVKYAAMISSPAKGVQPITFICDNYNDLEAQLKEAETGIDKKKVEITFHESRINTFKSRIAQHEERVKQLNDPDYEDIEMEEVDANGETEDQVVEGEKNAEKTN